MYSIKKLALALCLASLSASAMDLGMNIGEYAEFERGDYAADMMAMARPFVAQGCTVDANGWPTVNGCDTYVDTYSGPSHAGTYTLVCDGNCSYALQSSPHWSISASSFNAGTGKTSATLTCDGLGGNLDVKFNSCAPKNCHMMRPGTTIGDRLSPNFINAIAPYKVIRAMGISETNFSFTRTWSQRTPDTYATQQNLLTGDALGTITPYLGVSWETVIAMGNVAKKDLWINVPFWADDDYVTQLATLFKNTLDPSIHVYVELSNELWNSSFRQNHDQYDLANCEAFSTAWAQSTAYAQGGTGKYVTVSGGNCYKLTTDGTSSSSGAGPSGTGTGIADGTAVWSYVENVTGKTGVLNFDGLLNQFEVGYRYQAKRTMEISNLFRAVFGNARMMTQIRPVLMGQMSEGGTHFGLQVLTGYYGINPASVLYGIGCAPYWDIDGQSSNDASLTLNRMFGEYPWGISQVLANVKTYVGEAKRWGLKTVLYEGGEGTIGGTALAVKTAADTDPRMGDMITLFLKGLRDLGVDEFTYLGFAADNNSAAGHWAVYQDITQPTVKSIALANFAMTEFARPKFKKTILGNEVTFSDSSHATGTSAWNLGFTPAVISYRFRAPGYGLYRFTFSYSTVSTASQLTVKLNGTALSTNLALANTSGTPTTSSTYYVWLNAGDNGIEFSQSANADTVIYSLQFTDN